MTAAQDSVASSSAESSAAQPEAPYPREKDFESYFDRPRAVAAPSTDARITIDLPYLISTQVGPSGGATLFEGTPAIRAGMLFPAPQALDFMNVLGGTARLGFDSALGFTFSRSGTLNISGTSLLMLSETRGILGLDFELPILTVMPYLFAGGVGGAGLKSVSVLGVSRAYPNLVVGLRSGVGVVLKLWWLTLRLDSGVGLRNGQPEVVSSMALGLMF